MSEARSEASSSVMARIEAAYEPSFLPDRVFETAEVYESNNETGTSGIVLSELAKSYARELSRVAGWLDWHLGISPSPTEERSATDPAGD